MPSINITISAEVHARLKKLKNGKESFSEVLSRELPDHDLPALVMKLWPKKDKARPARHAKKTAV